MISNPLAREVVAAADYLLKKGEYADRLAALRLMNLLMSISQGAELSQLARDSLVVSVTIRLSGLLSHRDDVARTMMDEVRESVKTWRGY